MIAQETTDHIRLVAVVDMKQFAFGWRLLAYGTETMLRGEHLLVLNDGDAVFLAEIAISLLFRRRSFITPAVIFSGLFSIIPMPIDNATVLIRSILRILMIEIPIIASVTQTARLGSHTWMIDAFNPDVRCHIRFSDDPQCGPSGHRDLPYGDRRR